MKFQLLLSIFLLTCAILPAQVVNEYLGDESILYSETKQINQFFRRFNGEERTTGDRIYQGDPLFHSTQLREGYLNMLFDKSNAAIADSLKRAFIREALRGPRFLDFHGGKWLAEVQCTFTYQGISQPLTLFLQLEEAPVGSKWVFTDVYFQPFKQMFVQPQTESGLPFLHPLSHELDFMNLEKVFREPSQADRFAASTYSPDYLTLFLYELKKGTFRFQTVNKVKFHFYQVNGWYFQVNDVQRQNPNRGWLITQLIRIPEGQEQRLLDFIYRK